jgi:hypothetical protein
VHCFSLSSEHRCSHDRCVASSSPACGLKCRFVQCAAAFSDLCIDVCAFVEQRLHDFVVAMTSAFYYARPTVLVLISFRFDPCISCSYDTEADTSG